MYRHCYPVVLLLFSILIEPSVDSVWAAGGELEIVVVDRKSGEPLTCRMHLKKTASGRARKIPRTPFWHDHFPIEGQIKLHLPNGAYSFQLERGPEYVTRGGRFSIDTFAGDSKEVDLYRFVDMTEHGWYSGDLDIRRPIHQIEPVLLADDLYVAPLITWWNEKDPWATKPPPEKPLVRFDGDRFYHLMSGGHERPGSTLVFFNRNASMPLEADVVDSEHPSPEQLIEQARRDPNVWIDLNRPFSWDLPMLVANDLIDSIQVVHGQLCREKVIGSEGVGKPRDRHLYPGISGNARWSQAIYFHLLESGLRIPPTAGSGSGYMPNPVGYNRLYVHVEGPFTYEKWWENLRKGRVTLTNGPLLRPSVRGELPGHVFRGEKGQTFDFEIGLSLSTREPIRYLELIKNGHVEHSIRFEEYQKSGKLPVLSFTESGWFLIRAVTDLDRTYRFAMTGPYFVEFDSQPRISRRSVKFFHDWLYERARQIQLSDSTKRREVIGPHRRARDFWLKRLDRANAK